MTIGVHSSPNPQTPPVSQLGPPSAQRGLRADSERVQQLYRFSTEIKEYWNTHGGQVPVGLAQLPSAAAFDPITHASYEYHPGQGSQYELCALFARGSDPREAASPTPSPWIHPAGRHCFSLDARSMALFPQQYP